MHPKKQPMKYHQKMKEPEPHWFGEQGERHSIKFAGSWLKWRVSKPKSKAKVTSKRGIITTFSGPSRYRMFQVISRINWEKVNPAVMITLTFPDRVKEFKKEELTDYRSEFMRKIENCLDREVYSLWRTEWKRRKTGMHVGLEYPHFHILLPKVYYIHYSTVNDLWKRTIGYDGQCNTDIRRAGTAEKCAKYAAKYCGKKDQCSLDIESYLRRTVGRQWGMNRKKLWPWHTETKLHLIDTALTDYLRQIALTQRPQLNQYGNESFTLLGPLAEAISEELFQGMIDGTLGIRDNATMR